MRVALVNDLKMALEALRRVVLSIPGTEIAWVAEDGRQAVERCRRDRPDLILMDMIMPELNGVEATRQIMGDCPCPILVTTASVQGNVDYVYEALGCGAVDAVDTPVLGTGGTLEGAQELVRKVRQFQRLAARPEVSAPDVGRAVPAAATVSALPPLAVVGASTGGPEAIRRLLAGLPQQRPYAVLIVQHLEQRFVPGLVQWLARESKLPVQTIETGRPPAAGCVGIACTADHLVLDSRANLQYVVEPAASIHRPSVDVLLLSLLTAPVRPGVAVLLTGMGQDGVTGLRRLKDAGWETIAQDQATSVVWGMPGAAVRRGAARCILPADEIGPAVDRTLRGVKTMVKPPGVER